MATTVRTSTQVYVDDDFNFHGVKGINLAPGVSDTDAINLAQFNIGLGLKQAAHANLTSLAGLVFASTALIKMTAAGTFELDTNVYLTSVTAHNLLSSTHSDTLADTVVRGDILIGNSTPKWARLAFPATPTGKILQATATDVSWSANPLTIGANASVSGSNTGDQTITLTGEATGSGTGSFAATLSNSAVIGKVLTGYTVGSGAIAATDSILQAIQKLGYDQHVAVTLATNHGLSLTGQQLAMGTPSTLTSSTTNAVTTTTHTHAITGSLGLMGNGSAQYQLPVTGATPFTPTWVTATNLVGASGLNALTYVSASFVKMTAANTFAVRTLAETLGDLAGAATSGTGIYWDRTGTTLSPKTAGDLIKTTGGIISPKWYPSSDGTTAIQINKADGSTNIVNIDTTNLRVGFKITNPATTFHVWGESTFQSIAGNAPPATINFLSANSNAYGNSFVVYSKITSTAAGGAYNSALRFYTTNTANELLERMIINKDGYVGFNTPTPSTPFHCVGEATYQSVTGNSQIALLSFLSTNSGAYGGSLVVKSKIDSYTAGGAYNSILRFYTNSDDNTLTERVRIDNNGSVFIGYTSDPTSGNKFAVNGAAYLASSLTATTATFNTVGTASGGTLIGVTSAGLLTKAPTNVGAILNYGSSKTFSSAYDLVTKEYVDATTAGLAPKLPVDYASTGNLTLSGTQTIDGYSATAGKRVLVKNQTTATENGVYIVASGTWSRDTEMDAWAELYKAYTVVENGSTNIGTSWICTIGSSGTVGVNDITWQKYGIATTITASTGLVRVGNDIRTVTDGTTIEVDGGTNALKVKANVFAPYGITTSSISEGSNLYYTDARARLALSSTATGLTYTNTTGVFSLTSGYVIPTTTEQTSWTNKVASITGTTDRITVSGTTTVPVIDIASTYAGQNTIVTLGTIGTGVWQGTAVADSYIASAATWNAKQAGHANLTSLSTLSYVSASFVKMTAAGTFALDTTAYLSNTPAALTKVDDTNVTLILGGTPATALLQAVSLTLGWTGTLADARIASATTWNNKVTSISGTTNRITVGGTTTVPTIDIASTYTGQNTITTLGTIATGTWQASRIANAYLAQVATSTIKGRATAGTGDVEDLSATQVKTMLGLTSDTVLTRIYREVPSGTINGTNYTFTLAYSAVTGTEEVFLNGQLQTSAEDYTLSGSTLTFISGSIPKTGWKLVVSYSK